MKSFLFYLMKFCRPFLKIGLKLFSFLLVLTAIISPFMIKPNGVAMAITCLIMAFVLFLIGQAYDRIMLLVAPEGTILFD